MRAAYCCVAVREVVGWLREGGIWKEMRREVSRTNRLVNQQAIMVSDNRSQRLHAACKLEAKRIVSAQFGFATPFSQQFKASASRYTRRGEGGGVVSKC